MQGGASKVGRFKVFGARPNLNKNRYFNEFFTLPEVSFVVVICIRPPSTAMAASARDIRH